MNSDDYPMDLGFIITKAPLESGLVRGALTIAKNAVEGGKKIGIFLISDGVWLAKKDQRNPVAESFIQLLAADVEVTLSKEHLEAAGIKDHELVEGVTIAKNTYRSLVENVMEKWRKVMSI